jgi:RNA processing factor Prp31
MDINTRKLESLDDKSREILMIQLLNELYSKVSELSDLIKGQEELCDNIKKMAESSNTKVYTDEELFKLKEQLSWSKLSTRTGIPVSTLQSRCRRYRNSI